MRAGRAEPLLAALLPAALLATTLPAATGRPEPQGEAQPFARAFVEATAGAATFYVQQEIPVRVRAGVEDRFLREQALQPFRQHLDLPVVLRIEWWDGRPGLEVFDRGEAPARGGLRLVCNQELTVASSAEAGDRPGFRTAALQRSFLASRPGRLQLAGPTMTLVYATRFRDDFVAGRVPEDRHEVVLQAQPLALTILPLPSEGRPPSFGGAVGSFAIAATAEPREVAAGDSVQLTLRIEGRGNFAHFEPPRLDGLPGFHLRGQIEDHGPGYRTIVYDLVPLHGGVRQVPPIAFAFFDPAPGGGYRVLRSGAIPISVRGGPEGPAAVPAAGAGPSPPALHDVMPVAPGAGGAARVGTGWLLLWLLLPWLLALSWSWHRRRRQRPVSRETLLRAAMDQVRAAAPGGAGPLALALVDYLALRLDRAPAAVVDPGLAGRLQREGLPPELADRAADWLETLQAARFGGEPPADATVRTLELVEALEAAWPPQSDASDPENPPAGPPGGAKVLPVLLALMAGWPGEAPAQQQAAPDPVAKAAEAYGRGLYDEAMQAYATALREGRAAAGPLLYNLGNCAYRLGRFAEAILYYRRALLRLPGDPRVRDNLALAEQALGIRARQPETLLERLAERLEGVPETWWLALACLLQTTGLLGFMLLRHHRLARLAAAALLVLGLAAGIRLVARRIDPPPLQGVVLAERTALRVEPHRQLAVVLELQAGEPVRVEEYSDRWMRVTHSLGQGWVPRPDVGLVE